jgi:DNA-binding transcriptional LysR family regulator
MRREELVELYAFLVVAEEQSFTRAAAKLATSQSALSHTIRRLEDHLGIRLLTRTTRSVAPTEAGQRLLKTLVPALDDIAAELSSVRELRDKPVGNIRITASDHAFDTILWPALRKFHEMYPDINVEIDASYDLKDIVADRFDAGVRLGESVAKDMVAVRIGPDLRMVVVGAPSYFARRPKPRKPQELAEHSCINLRLSMHGRLYAWELQKGRREMKVRVDGPLIFNNTTMIVQAALAGFGLGFVMEDQVVDHLKAGSLVTVLDDWCTPFGGYYLYYPSRRQPTAAFSLLVDALRYRD